ncbi:AbrB family transcriptional regulator [Tardiphaga sp.]|uniref:AbrB/MazE/SpoVT family DNA-binding domain-containing protein n=1 Tax=Tardiphaga sp. TaxID=1926292 RepID=UPI0025EE514D|nr:AbrB family transcriptional regulator [Tardiphaga sp.]
MIVTKIGDSLGIRLSAEDVARLGLKEGDKVVVKPLDITSATITDPLARKKALEDLLRFEGMMPAGFKFDRDEANER